MSDLSLYFVRQKFDKQAVGVFWAIHLDDLAIMVDAATETTYCEYCLVEESGGLYWGGRVGGLGVWRDFDTIVKQGSADEPNIHVGDIELKDLIGDASPIGSFEPFFQEEMDDDEWDLLIEGDGLPRTPEEFAAAQKRYWNEIAAAADRLPGASPEKPKVPPPDLTTNVYFIECDGHVKIGMTEGSVEKRLKALATGHHRELTLLHAIIGASGTLEFELHQRFAQHRVRGEWFKLSPEIQAYIDEVKGK